MDKYSKILAKVDELKSNTNIDKMKELQKGVEKNERTIKMIMVSNMMGNKGGLL